METETVPVETHKGGLCIFRPIICQEGFCSACQIYLDASKPPDKRS